MSPGAPQQQRHRRKADEGAGEGSERDVEEPGHAQRAARDTQAPAHVRLHGEHQTEPGRYFPSCPTKKTLALDGNGRGVPRSASRTRQPTSVSQGATRASRKAPPRDTQESRANSLAPPCPNCLQRSEDRDETRRPTTIRAPSSSRFLVTGLAYRRRKVSRRIPCHAAGVASRDRAPVATHAAHEVTVQVADEHQAEVAGACQDTPDVGGVSAHWGRLSERQGDDEQAAGTQCPRGLTEGMVDVVGRAPTGMEAGDDVQARGVDVEDLDRGPPTGQPSSTGAKPSARTQRDSGLLVPDSSTMTASRRPSPSVIRTMAAGHRAPPRQPPRRRTWGA